MPVVHTATSRRTGTLAAIAIASVLLLSTGCAPDLAIGGSGSGGGSGSNSSNGNGNSTGTEGDDSHDGEGAGVGTANLKGKECLPGEWLFDNDGFEKFLGSLSGNFDIAVSGKATVTLRADGTNQTNYDKWTHDVSVKDGKSIVVRHGIDKGTYTASDDGAMSMTDTSIGSVTTMTINAGGQVINRSVKPEPSIFSQGSFTCNGDNLVITVDGYDAEMFRQH